MCYVLRISPVSSPVSSPASPPPLSLCVLMCFSDDKADLCPIGFAAKRHNSCFYDRMPIKALNVANCRRFFNKYKMCPGTKATKPRKGKSLRHTKHAARGGRRSRSVACMSFGQNRIRSYIHCEAAFHLICLLKSSSFMSYSSPAVRHIDSLSKIAAAERCGVGGDAPDNLLA